MLSFSRFSSWCGDHVSGSLLSINNVIFQMETTIKQAEEDRNKSLETAKRLYEDYQPLKQHVDMLRASVGLDRLSEVSEDEPKFTPKYV